MKTVPLLPLLLCSTFALSQASAPTIVWNRADDCCSVIYENGVAHERFAAGKLLVDVYPPTALDRHIEKVRIAVSNRATSDAAIDVDPAHMAASADHAGRQVLPSVDIDRRLPRALHPSARLPVSAPAAPVSASLPRDRYTSLGELPLRRNTLNRGQNVVGDVYFARPRGLDPKVPLNAVAISLNGTTYIFPFESGRVPNLPGLNGGR